jgi:hypothetical protein
VLLEGASSPLHPNQEIAMKQPTTRTILAQLGLEPRRSTSARVATVSSMVGLGAVLGAGAVLLSRLEPVRKLFQKSAPPEKAVPAPRALQTA